jgi:NADP-dependent aldehyde dehydrogenase
LLFVLDHHSTDLFVSRLTELLQATPESTMLNQTICKSYYKELRNLQQEKAVKVWVEGKDVAESYKGSAALMEVAAEDFISNPKLQNEVFGPSSLLIRCSDKDQLTQAIQSLQGQLTGTVIGTEEDLKQFSAGIDLLTEKVGRLIFNGVPTGVEVCYAMVHGGPFPATTDSRSTSVGAEAIKRFVRPVCFQDCPQDFLPDPLKNTNPLGIMRKVNGNLTREPISD